MVKTFYICVFFLVLLVLLSLPAKSQQSMIGCLQGLALITKQENGQIQRSCVTPNIAEVFVTKGWQLYGATHADKEIIMSETYEQTSRDFFAAMTEVY